MIRLREHLENLDPSLSARLQARTSLYHLSQRLAMESGGRDPWHKRRLAERLPTGRILAFALSLTGLRSRGRSNALAPVVRHNRVHLAALPKSFDGYRILHLTDLHLDINDRIMDVLLETINGLDYDLCVLTGDFCECHDEALLKAALPRLRDKIDGDVWCVLGNHDSITIVPWLEDHDFGVLLNERVEIRRNGETIALAGVDDCHYFGLTNLERALGDAKPEETVILLSHSPESFRQAGYAGVDLFLCGHTHGGQVCLPGGWALTFNIECTRKVGRGAWYYRGMSGYTSQGVGTSMVDVRYNCPPEVVIHELTSD